MPEHDRTTTPWGIGPRLAPRPRVPALVALVEDLPALVLIEAKELLVGRALRCGLRLGSRGVSREHAKLLSSAGTAVSLVDLRSRNGTFVNGRRIDAVELREGDELHFGPIAAFRFTLLLAPGVVVPRARRALDLDTLSNREHEVAALVANGLSNTAIAEQLGIRPRTVATHLEHIFAKLEIGSRAELMLRVFAGERGRRP